MPAGLPTAILVLQVGANSASIRETIRQAGSFALFPLYKDAAQTNRERKDVYTSRVCAAFKHQFPLFYCGR